MDGRREEAIERFASYDPATDQSFVEKGEEQRNEIRERFPLEGWPSMDLADYAIGQEDSTDTYCRWVEFNSPNLGSIRGGSSKKLIIYKRKNGPGWYYDEAAFGSETEAWEKVRSEFVAALDAAAEGQWIDIDQLMALKSGPALLIKTLHIYFPDAVLPITSRTHLSHFLDLLEHPAANDKKQSALQLNLLLLDALESIDEGGLSTVQLERFLYRYFPPESAASWWKISPGEKATHWNQFRDGGFAAVGWTPIGDLRDFADHEEFAEFYREAYADHYGGHAHVIARKANELWRMIELRPGDRIVANQGTSKVLAVGTVVEPTYYYDESNEPYHHMVKVEWDESYAKEIEPQSAWLNTIDKVKQDTIKLIEGAETAPGTALPQLDPLYPLMEEALEAKGQMVLYGPPGTGKTFHARRFAAWWLSKESGHTSPEAVLADSEALLAAERDLSSAASTGNSWVLVANSKNDWKWGDLFENGHADFAHRRLGKNFPKITKGDLVFGYASTPIKKFLAIARVDRELGTLPGDDHQTIGIVPVVALDDGPTYKELVEDQLLVESEPLIHKFRGTLFALTQTQADHLTSLIGEREPEKIEELDAESSAGQWNMTTFHPSYSYEDFVEGFRPVTGTSGDLSLSLEDGLFKRLCLTARSSPEKPFVLIVDEINRANLAKVFGELITLLEKDKRGVKITLPQSKERFEVPPNVFIIGTMNTADRSITMMDVALRRRFAFVELMPDPDSVEQTIGPLKLADFLAGLNASVARIAGREKQIGHSYFLQEGQPIVDSADFARIFRMEIVPLLQEYCFEEYEQLEEILGPDLVDIDGQSLKISTLMDPDELLQTLATRFSSSAAEE